MKETTHIVPVGHTKETIIESLRRHPLGRVILVTGDNPGVESERKARQTILEVRKALGTVPAQEVYVNLNDIPSIALTIIEIIREEDKQGRQVLLNLSGSLRSLDIACYMAALATKSQVYVGIPSYRKDKITGVDHIQDIPLFPTKIYQKEKKLILEKLGRQGKTLEQLTTQLKTKVKKGTQAYLTEKSRISHHIKDLKKEGLIETSREGKTLNIQLTTIGKIYVEGLNV